MHDMTLRKENTASAVDCCPLGLTIVQHVPLTKSYGQTDQESRYSATFNKCINGSCLEPNPEAHVRDYVASLEVEYTTLDLYPMVSVNGSLS